MKKQIEIIREVVGISPCLSAHETQRRQEQWKLCFEDKDSGTDYEKIDLPRFFFDYGDDLGFDVEDEEDTVDHDTLKRFKCELTILLQYSHVLPFHKEEWYAPREPKQMLLKMAILQNKREQQRIVIDVKLI